MLIHGIGLGLNAKFLGFGLGLKFSPGYRTRVRDKIRYAS